MSPRRPFAGGHGRIYQRIRLREEDPEPRETLPPDEECEDEEWEPDGAE